MASRLLARLTWPSLQFQNVVSKKNHFQLNPRKVACLLFNLNSSHQKTKFLNIPTISALKMPRKFSSRRHIFAFLENTSKRYCTSYIPAILCPQSVTIRYFCSETERYFFTDGILLRPWFSGGGLGLNAV